MKIIRDFVTNSSEPDYYSDCNDCDCSDCSDCHYDCDDDCFHRYNCDCNDDCYSYDCDCDDCQNIDPFEEYISHIDDPEYYDEDGNYILDD